MRNWAAGFMIDMTLADKGEAEKTLLALGMAKMNKRNKKEISEGKSLF